MKQSLRASVLSLGAANAIDYGLQFLTPVILTRFLDASDFGAYRLFWLVVSTGMALTTLGMPQSLYYFLPRSDTLRKRLFIFQALVFLAMGGIVAAMALSPFNPWLPSNIRSLSRFGLLPSLFIVLWIVGCLADYLPTADGRPLWQTKIIVTLSLLRTLLLTATAALTGNLIAIFWSLLVFVLLKLSLLLFYVWRHHGLTGPYVDKRTFREQTVYAVPFGVAGMLYSLRAQADQWVASALFSISQYASFSVAAVLSPLVSLFRQSVNQAFLPRMSKLQADGELRPMLLINSRANVALAILLFPFLAFIFVFADALISLVFTRAYLSGANAMRIYALGMVAMTIELNNVMLLLKEGNFAMRVNAIALSVGIAASYFGAKTLGLAGAALGGVLAVYVERGLTLRRIARTLALSIGAVQNWSAIGRILLAALLAAATAWAALGALAFSLSAPLQLIVAGVITAMSYVPALALVGMWPMLREYAVGGRG